MKEVGLWMASDVLRKYLYRGRRPKVVSQQDGDELGAGMAHPGIERTRQFASLVEDQPGAVVVQMIGDALAHASFVVRLTDDQEPPGRARLTTHGIEGLAKVARPIPLDWH